MHDGDDLDLDDPSNLPPNEGPPDLPPPMAMLPSNRPISNNYQNYPGKVAVSQPTLNEWEWYRVLFYRYYKIVMNERE